MTWQITVVKVDNTSAIYSVQKSNHWEPIFFMG